MKAIESVQLSEGGQCFFRYVLTGEPLPDVQWFKGSIHIEPAGFNMMVNNPDGSGFFSIVSVKQEHSGIYTCKCSMELRPPVFVKRLEGTTVWKRGSTARLQCTVKGSPELHTTWFFNNSELSSGGRYAASFKDGVATLEINNVTLSDSGSYSCEVLNESGCESCSTKVTVKEPPSFIKDAPSIEAVRGSVAVLDCEIAGSAPFEVTWKKNKKRLSSDKKYRVVSQGSLTSLEIHTFESADAGEYECVVSNEVGSVTSNSVVKQKG
uniref:Ig-like domain-containing protein n=1 Tax=Poecilia latipinna TaxID=48699 RepID=A0A3B3V3U7_9TELE